jgi:hypothetical protein
VEERRMSFTDNNEKALEEEMSRRGFEKRRKVREGEIERNVLKKERKV